jgi:acetyltransferase-like isoleucine patch superfamily enzyme
MLNSLDTPWKILNEVRRWLALPAARLLFAFYAIPWGYNWRIYGIPIIQKHRQSQMEFGNGLHLRSIVGSNPLGANHPVILSTWRKGANLQIGDYFAMTGGTICCTESITIGNHVGLGANSTVIDTDFHPLTPEARRIDSSAGKTAPVIIEDEVFIGMNCLILKGVTIGKSSVIGAGSVVTSDVPPGVIAAGNPARVIRQL